MGYLQTSARENDHWINAVLEVSQVNHCNEFWKEALVRRLGAGREATLGSTSWLLFGMNNQSVIITTTVTCHCSPEGTSGISLTLKGTEMDKTSTVTYVLSPGCNLWTCDTTLQINCHNECERNGKTATELHSCCRLTATPFYKSRVVSSQYMRKDKLSLVESLARKKLTF